MFDFWSVIFIDYSTFRIYDVRISGEKIVLLKFVFEVMQTRHTFVGEIRIFSVKIRINPYPSSMHRSIAKTFKRLISRCSLQKNRDIV